MEEGNLKLYVPSATLDKLLCVICSKYLSVFPVYLSPELGPVCGRCPTTNLTGIVRNTTYETVVAEFRFPCCNYKHGCVEYFLPSEISRHEIVCTYRRVDCPMIEMKLCNWTGPCTELLEHYESVHPVYLMKQLDFEVNFVNSFNENYLLLYGDELFIFKRKADAKINTMWFSVLYFGWNLDPEAFYYQIKLKNRTINCEKVYAKMLTKGFDENITTIVADEVKRELMNPSVIIGSIEITVKEETKSLKEKLVMPEICTDMLDTIECPVCFEYMVPPIYQCLGGHSICGKCKESVSQCPTCKQGVKDTRNFILEKMVNYLQYPCKNRDNGCAFVLEGINIKKHETLCEFGTYKCPLNDYMLCNFQSKLSDLHNHLMDEHHDNILEIETVHVPSDDNFDQDIDCYVLKHLEKLFLLHFRIKNHAFWWCLQYIGSPDNAKKYMCEIDIIDNISRKNRFFLKSLCGYLTSKHKCFGEDMPYIKVEFKQIEHFISDTFSYRVRVVKDN